MKLYAFILFLIGSVILYLALTSGITPNFERILMLIILMGMSWGGAAIAFILSLVNIINESDDETEEYAEGDYFLYG